MAREMTFVMAMRDFFGLKPGQTLVGFVEEIKALNDADRVEFTRILQDEAGYLLKAA